jgi:hypothetical protein
LKKGGGQYVDIIGYHFYVNPHTKLPEEMVPFIQDVRRVVSENNLDSKPLWNTESGWFQPAHFDSEEIAAGILARAYILAWAAGIQRFYWYAWDNRLMAVRTYNEEDHTVTPAGHGYQIIQEWLVGAQMAGCAKSANDIWTCQLNRSGKKQWIVWNPQGNRKFDVPAAWHVASITPFLHDRKSLTESKIDIGPVPVLLSVRTRE